MPAVEHTRSSDMTPVQFAAVDTTASVNTPIVAAHLLVCVWARVCVWFVCVCAGRFFTCVRVGRNDISTGIAITGNTMVGGWTPADPTPPTVVQAIALSAAASTPTSDRDWLIQNNDIR